MKWRQKLAAALVAAVLCSAPSHAQNGLAFEVVTFTGTATGFTATTIRPDGLPPMTVCSGRLETAEIRFRVDGTAPTSGVGTLVEVGDLVVIVGLDKLTGFKGIRTTGTSGVINFTCSR